MLSMSHHGASFSARHPLIASNMDTQGATLYDIQNSTKVVKRGIPEIGFPRSDRSTPTPDATKHGPGPGLTDIRVDNVRPRVPKARLCSRPTGNQESKDSPGPGRYGESRPAEPRQGQFNKATRGCSDRWESGRSPGPGQYNVERASRGSGRRAPSAALSGRHGDMGERGGGAGVGFVGVPS